MLKNIDYLYHFTKNLDSVKEIIKHGFKPSYAKEKLDDKNILVGMVSFSNILLRDVGDSEVIFYGEYAICFTRDWGIANNINPVVYTYKTGLLNTALNSILYSTIFLKVMQTYKEQFKLFSEKKYGKFSDHLHLTNTPKEVLAILDYLTVNYNEELVDIMSNHAKLIYDTNFPILTLTKEYKVYDSNGKEFIAYNDREWRKLYSDLKIIFESDLEYDAFTKKSKPHFDEDKYRLYFNIEDVKAILVKTDNEIIEMKEYLINLYTDNIIDKLISSKSLIIGTKDVLIGEEF